MKKHYTPLKKNKIIKHILETNGDKNNSISKDKFESIKYNSTTNSQTKQNMKYKKIQLKNKIENLFSKFKGIKYNLKKTDKRNKRYINNNIFNNTLNKNISNSKIIQNKIINNNSLDYKIISYKPKNIGFKYKLKKKKTPNIFYSLNNYIIDKNMIKTKNKNLNNSISAQKTFDTININSKIKNINRTIINKKYSIN